MVKYLIERPVAVLTTFIALLLLGVVVAKIIPVSPLPDIDIPEITVHISQKNTNAKELENSVVASLRVQLQQLPGIEDIHSSTVDGSARIHLRFKYGTNINYAFIEANEKVDYYMNFMPRGVERPRVVKSSISEIPVFYINLSLKDRLNGSVEEEKFTELCDFAKNIVKRRFEQLPEIAMADITGLDYPEIYITPKAAAMQSLGINENGLQSIFEQNNIQPGSIEVRDGFFEYTLRLASAKLLSVTDIKNIRFKNNGRIFSIGDIAEVGLRKQTPTGCFVSQNNNAVSLAVIKQADAQMDELNTSTNNLLSSLRFDYPTINFEQVRNQTALLEFSINNLKQDLILGGCLAFAMLFLFFKNLRTPLLIGITVPISLLLSLLFFHLFHISINIISLSGMVLGVGLMIDNSIIVIDNITQKKASGLSLEMACSSGTNEIIRPLLSSVLTTTSVFLPLIFLSGISGALFYDQAMAITIGLCVSFIVAITLLPVLYHLLHLKGRYINVGKIVIEENFVQRLYNNGFEFVFKHQIITTLSVILLLLINIFIFRNIKKEQLPKFEKTELSVDIDWNQNIHINENKHRVIKLISQISYAINESDAQIGEQQYLMNKDKSLSSSEAQIYLKIKDRVNIDSLRLRLFNIIQNQFPEALVSIAPPKTIFEKVFGESKGDLIAEFYINNQNDRYTIEKISQLSEKIRNNFPNTVLKKTPVQYTKNVIPDPEKMMLYNVSMDMVNNKLRTILNVNNISNLRSGRQLIPIVLNTPEKDLQELMQETSITNSLGVQIPLASFATIKDDVVYKNIVGGKRGQYIPIYMENTGNPKSLMDSISQWTRNDQQIQLAFSGNYFDRRQLVKEMAFVLLISVLLLYFILAAQFESLLQPVIVLMELPISLSAALLALYLFGSSINLMSMIGIITICGIIINDSILKIDTINQLRMKNKYSLIQAIHTGGSMRLNSIVMTSMTTILSVSPFLFGNDMGSTLQRPLSLTILGGMLVGTLVSLFFIPLVYYWCYKGHEKNEKTSDRNQKKYTDEI